MIITENDEFEVAVVKGDEMWSFVGNKNNDQWLWLHFSYAPSFSVSYRKTK